MSQCVVHWKPSLKFLRKRDAARMRAADAPPLLFIELASDTETKAGGELIGLVVLTVVLYHIQFSTSLPVNCGSHISKVPASGKGQQGPRRESICSTSSCKMCLLVSQGITRLPQPHASLLQDRGTRTIYVASSKI